MFEGIVCDGAHGLGGAYVGFVGNEIAAIPAWSIVDLRRPIAPTAKVTLCNSISRQCAERIFRYVATRLRDWLGEGRCASYCRSHVARRPRPASRSDVGALIAILHDRTRSSDGRPRPSSPSKTMDFWRSTCTRKSSRRSASPHRRRQVIPESAAAEGVSGTCFDLATLLASGNCDGEVCGGVRAIGNDRVLSGARRRWWTSVVSR